MVDGKGDMGENSILDMTMKLSGEKKVYVINLNDPVHSDKYNPFQNANSTMVKDMLINMTEWSEEHYKSNTERYLQRLVYIIDKLGIKLSFKSIVKNMSVEKFNKLSMELLKKEAITKEEHLENIEISNTCGKIAENASARFSTMLESDDLKHIFDDNGIDIYQAICENAIILFILNPLIYAETTGLFGKLILIDSKKAIGGFFNDKKRKFFIYDEIATYGNTALLDIVNKSRSANLTCVLATQSLSDLDTISESYKEQIIENCNNYLVLRQNSATNAEKWSAVLGTRSTLEVTFQLQQKNSNTSETGYGSAKPTRAFSYHPDDIKTLQVGQGIFMSKDNNFHSRITVNKPF